MIVDTPHLAVGLDHSGARVVREVGAKQGLDAILVPSRAEELKVGIVVALTGGARGARAPACRAELDARLFQRGLFEYVTVSLPLPSERTKH